MSILFIGWNDNGEKCLQALIGQKIPISCIFVPAGYETEKMYLIAKEFNIPIMEVGTDMQKMKEQVFDLQPDLIAVASFPKLITQDIIDLPRLGVINVHTGELPKYRGWHPLNWAIIRDEDRIGVTVHYIDRGMDTGDILAQGTTEVSNSDTVNTVRDRITTIGAELLSAVVQKAIQNNAKLVGTQQRDSQALFAPKRSESDGKIKWSNRSRDIFNLIRALASPTPNSFCFRKNGEKINISKSYVSTSPGEVLAEINDQFLISTGDGVILVSTDKKLDIGEKLL